MGIVLQNFFFTNNFMLRRNCWCLWNTSVHNFEISVPGYGGMFLYLEGKKRQNKIMTVCNTAVHNFEHIGGISTPNFILQCHILVLTFGYTAQPLVPPQNTSISNFKHICSNSTLKSIFEQFISGDIFLLRHKRWSVYNTSIHHFEHIGVTSTPNFLFQG